MTDPAVYTGRAAVRAGIVVTGTEVLSGAVRDSNGPWLSERLRELGVEVAMIELVGDRPDDLLTALTQIAATDVALIVTTGGLGPTADDLTAELVGRFCGRAMLLDEALERRIAAIVAPSVEHRTEMERESLRAANRKQAQIPEGATVLEPQGTAPGLVVQSDGQPTVLVLPGPPRELQAMWPDAVGTEAFARATAGAVTRRSELVRLYRTPEAEIADTLRAADAAGVELGSLEITTCLRRGELEITTSFEPAHQADYDALLEFVAARHPDTLFSRDGSTIDQQVAAMLAARRETIATAESCTGGLLAARLTDLPGSSAYVLGGVAAYSNSAKAELVGVDPELIARHGAVSSEVALALAQGARTRFGATVGVGITGVAGPGGGTPEKPVGQVCFCVAYGPAGDAEPTQVLPRIAQLRGDRAAIRERSTTVAMHMVATVLRACAG